MLRYDVTLCFVYYSRDSNLFCPDAIFLRNANEICLDVGWQNEMLIEIWCSA